MKWNYLTWIPITVSTCFQGCGVKRWTLFYLLSLSCLFHSSTSDYVKSKAALMWSWDFLSLSDISLMLTLALWECWATEGESSFLHNKNHFPVAKSLLFTLHEKWEYKCGWGFFVNLPVLWQSYTRQEDFWNRVNTFWSHAYKMTGMSSLKQLSFPFSTLVIILLLLGWGVLQVAGKMVNTGLYYTK